MTGSTERTPLDRFLALIPVAIAALVLLSILFWEAAARHSPTIFTDELEWTQISRAIAHTGHAARRGEPIGFKSLYAYLIAPGWWLHSTSTAYDAIKYLNTLVMATAAVPVYLLARLLVSRRAATIVALGTLCTSAYFFAALLLPEVLAYPTFALLAYASVRALAGDGRRWVIAAGALSLVAVEVRGELIAALGALLLAAAWLWVVGPRGRRFRAGWSRADHVGAVVLLVGAFVLANRLAAPHAYQWAYTTEYWQGRIWHYGLVSASALAIGLAVLPMVAGLASLWVPERRNDPRWRAFATYLAASIVTFGTYTGVKAAFLSTGPFARVEERNLIYLGPLLLVGSAVYFSSQRRWLPGVLAATAFTGWLVLHYGYELGYPYFESPGYGIAAMANRAFRWDQPTIRLALVATCAVSLAVVLLPRRARWRTPVLGVAALTVAVWMSAGEVTSARGSEHQANQFVDALPKPLDWVERGTHGAGYTYLTQQIDDPTGLWLIEFWNPGLRHVDSIDGTAPGPGPTLTPAVDKPDGTLRGDSGLDYVLAENGVRVIGPVLARRGDRLLIRVPSHPWHLKDSVYGRDSGGWIRNDGAYAYFGPERSVGTLTVDVGRAAFCAAAAPKAHVTVTVGPVGLDPQNNPIVAHATSTTRFVLSNCTSVPHTYRVRPPVAVHVHVTPLVVPLDYGISDSRHLGAQVAYNFTTR